jgi:hypothetical protein
MEKKGDSNDDTLAESWFGLIVGTFHIVFSCTWRWMARAYKVANRKYICISSEMIVVDSYVRKENV